VDAVEQVIGSDYDDDDMDMEPNPVLEPNHVSPSVSSMSLEETSVGAAPNSFVQTESRQDVVTSPTGNPEDFTIHNTIGTTSISGAELSPTSVACMMDIKDFEQKTSNYVDALDWLMDVGVYQLPAPAEEQEGEWGTGHATVVSTSSGAPVSKEPLSVSKLAQVNSSALSVLENDVF